MESEAAGQTAFSSEPAAVIEPPVAEAQPETEQAEAAQTESAPAEIAPSGDVHSEPVHAEAVPAPRKAKPKQGSAARSVIPGVIAFQRSSVLATKKLSPHDEQQETPADTNQVEFAAGERQAKVESSPETKRGGKEAAGMQPVSWAAL